MPAHNGESQGSEEQQQQQAAPSSPLSPVSGGGPSPYVDASACSSGAASGARDDSGGAEHRGAPPTASSLAVHTNAQHGARSQRARNEGYSSGASHSTHTGSSSEVHSARSVGGYVLTHMLGEGTFAKVYHGKHQESGENYAVKVLQKAELVKQPKARGKEMLYREISVLECLKGHPNIVELKEIMQTSSNIYIVMEIVQGGELLTRIHLDKGMPEDEARGYFQQIISAVDYCHKMQIAHRDIKPENIIVSSDGRVKMTDFGLSNLQMINDVGTVSHSLRLKTICGTPHYVAPEVITDTSMGYNGFLADVWSCGVVLYAMLSGGLPFRGTKPTSILKKISLSDPQPCERIPDQAWTLINSLLTKDPQSRMQIPGVLVDPWFSVGFDRSVIRTDISREKTLRLMAITKKTRHKQQAAGNGSVPASPKTPTSPKQPSA